MSDIDCKERRECGRGDSTVFIRETVEGSMRKREGRRGYATVMIKRGRERYGEQERWADAVIKVEGEEIEVQGEREKGVAAFQ